MKSSATPLTKRQRRRMNKEIIEKLDLEYERWKDSEGISLAKMKLYLHNRDRELLKEMVKAIKNDMKFEHSSEIKYGMNKSIQIINSLIEGEKEGE